MLLDANRRERSSELMQSCTRQRRHHQRPPGNDGFDELRVAAEASRLAGRHVVRQRLVVDVNPTDATSSSEMNNCSSTGARKKRASSSIVNVDRACLLRIGVVVRLDGVRQLDLPWAIDHGVICCATLTTWGVFQLPASNTSSSGQPQPCSQEIPAPPRTHCHRDGRAGRQRRDSSALGQPR